MKEINHEELKQIQLDIVSYIDILCRNYHIEYSLGGGTLIGAIRHKGYIPWDDDIDLMLTRDNYDALIRLLVEETQEHPQYGLLALENKTAHLPFAKLYDKRTSYTSSIDTLNSGSGVFVDIFPMDVMPTDPQKAKRFKHQIQLSALKLASSKRGGTSYASASKRWIFFAKLIVLAPWHLYYQNHFDRIASFIDKQMRTYNDTAERNIGYVGSMLVSECYDRKIFDSYEDTSFEGRTFCKIKQHDSYLKQHYGDYMQLPPVNKRENHDYYRWYWKDPV